MATAEVDHGITAHIPVLKQIQDQQERRRKIFPENQFIYDSQSDTYSCPAGQTLRKRKHWAERKAFEYVTAKGVCQKCSLRAHCTQSESGGRTLKRHERQEILDNLRVQAQSRSSKRDIQIRQHFMERSFAHGTRFGLKRARWRGPWRVQIQDYLIAIVQNIQLLIAHARPKPRMALALVNFTKEICAACRRAKTWVLSELVLRVTSDYRPLQTSGGNPRFFLKKKRLGNSPTYT
jgi:hypothetical protein